MIALASGPPVQYSPLGHAFWMRSKHLMGPHTLEELQQEWDRQHAIREEEERLRRAGDWRPEDE